MKHDLAAAMRQAMRLTHASDVAGATRAIQRALGSLPERADDPASGQPVDITPKRHLLDAPQPAPTAEPGEPTAAQTRRMPKAMAGMAAALRRTGSIEGLQPHALRRTRPLSIPDGAVFQTRAFANEAGSRNLRLYIPASARSAPRGLIVMLHGCRQNPDDFAAGTQMNRHAETHGLLVAYPAQTAADNQMACWNWFNPGDQQRGAGEPEIVAGIVRTLAAEFGIPRERTYVAGLSAGGAMAAILGETYPDLFAAIGVHSGLATGLAGDVGSAFAAMRGERGRRRKARPTDAGQRVRAIVFHGSADRTVHPSNAAGVLSPAAFGATTRTSENGVAGGLRYTRTIFATANGAGLAEDWAIEGAGHAWSGGSADGSFTDARGPDASAEMLRFFLAG